MQLYVSVVCLQWSRYFWATVCKTVRPMLLSVCRSVLSCRWRRCIVAKRLDGSSCNLASR